jgi:UDP-N-acetylglucosamine:LPS N-acetylglucosamine transferase
LTPRRSRKRGPAGRADRSKCLLVASSGGHLFQLFQLKEGFEPCDRHWVTFDTPDARSLLADEDDVTWAHHPTNRNVKNLLRNLVLAARMLVSIRPRTVITTGAGVAVPFCWLGRLLGARIVYIESFARVTEPSLTGRLVHPVAHDFFVQWPEVERHFRKARYRGALL